MSTRRVSLAVALVIVPPQISLLGTIITLLSKVRMWVEKSDTESTHAGDARRLDHIAHVERPIGQDEQAAGEIAQRALQGESDDKTGGTDSRQQGPNIHLQSGQGHDQAR